MAAEGGTWAQQSSKPFGPLSLAVQAEASIISLNPMDIYDVYKFDVILGKGHFGVTYLVIEKSTGLNWACKTISKRKLATEQDADDIRREIQIMKHMTGHKNIIKLKDVFEDREYIYMVLELCSGGELFQRIVQKTHYSEQTAASIMRTMLEVVAHLHAMGVVHRDLKPENVLLADETEDACLKTIDFGLSTWFRDGHDLTDVVGSPYYVAPEVLRKSHNKEVDVWSCGVMLYILLCGWPPFTGSTVRHILYNILHADVDLQSSPWDKISPAAKDCISKMLIKDPNDRISVQEALRHPWMVKNGVAPAEPLKIEVLERMKHFTTLNRFQKQAVRILVQHLSPDDVAGMKQMFTNMDSDSDGFITVKDLIAGLERRGARIAEDEVKELISSMDMDGDDAIDIQEFLAATANQLLISREENMIKVFRSFDRDGSGFITKEEVMAALNELRASNMDVTKVMRDADRNGDGRIDYEEFCTMMRENEKEQLHQAASALHGHIPAEVLNSLGPLTPRAPRPPSNQFAEGPPVVDMGCCSWARWQQPVVPSQPNSKGNSRGASRGTSRGTS